MLVPRLQDHLGIVAPARCARRTVTRDRRAGGAARAPLTLPRAGGRAEGGQVPPRGPGGGESCKARRRLPAWLAVRPGGGAGLARPQPLPPLRLSRRPRNAGGRGAGTPCEPPRPCLRCPSAPDARSRPTARTRRLPARAGADLAAVLRPSPCPGPERGAAWESARTSFRERPRPVGVAWKKKGLSWGGRWLKFLTG